ncbi:hypothetical protein CVT25_006236 [Psilocybe cyanescens]|uniref:Uncharacterized protein n=1 Tax=Psilocybe cyanescens TaxID=93625 RepID=A0A409XKJ1_PSICY|nr:hypothetical protein CVT25_006236 [Psilocybe cyanescens]
MHSKTIHRAIGAAAILFGGIQTAPLKAESELGTSEVSILADGRFYMCVDANFVERIPGLCLNIPFNAGQCHNLGNPFENAVSNLGPDGGWNCITAAETLLITKAGTIFDLSKIAGWNDVISSFRCRRQ